MEKSTQNSFANVRSLLTLAFLVASSFGHPLLAGEITDDLTFSPTGETIRKAPLDELGPQLEQLQTALGEVNATVNPGESILGSPAEIAAAVAASAQAANTP